MLRSFEPLAALQDMHKKRPNHHQHFEEEVCNNTVCLIYFLPLWSTMTADAFLKLWLPHFDVASRVSGCIPVYASEEKRHEYWLLLLNKICVSNDEDRPYLKSCYNLRTWPTPMTSSHSSRVNGNAFVSFDPQASVDHDERAVCIRKAAELARARRCDWLVLDQAVIAFDMYRYIAHICFTHQSWSTMKSAGFGALHVVILQAEWLSADRQTRQVLRPY